MVLNYHARSAFDVYARIKVKLLFTLKFQILIFQCRCTHFLFNFSDCIVCNQTPRAEHCFNAQIHKNGSFWEPGSFCLVNNFISPIQSSLH